MRKTCKKNTINIFLYIIKIVHNLSSYLNITIRFLFAIKIEH